MFGNSLQHNNTKYVEYTKYSSFFYCSPQNKYFLVHQVSQIFAHYIICFLFHKQSHFRPSRAIKLEFVLAPRKFVLVLMRFWKTQKPYPYFWASSNLTSVLWKHHFLSYCENKNNILEKLQTFGIMIYATLKNNKNL